MLLKVSRRLIITLLIVLTISVATSNSVSLPIGVNAEGWIVGTLYNEDSQINELEIWVQILYLDKNDKASNSNYIIKSNEEGEFALYLPLWKENSVKIQIIFDVNSMIYARLWSKKPCLQAIHHELIFNLPLSQVTMLPNISISSVDSIMCNVLHHHMNSYILSIILNPIMNMIHVLWIILLSYETIAAICFTCTLMHLLSFSVKSLARHKRASEHMFHSQTGSGLKHLQRGYTQLTDKLSYEEAKHMFTMKSSSSTGGGVTWAIGTYHISS